MSIQFLQRYHKFMTSLLYRCRQTIVEELYVSDRGMANMLKEDLGGSKLVEIFLLYHG